MEFYNNATVSPDAVIKLITSEAGYTLDGSEKLRLVKELPDAESRLSEADFLLGSLVKGPLPK